MKPLRVNEMQPSVAWAWPPDVLVLSHDLTTQLNTIKRYPAKLRVRCASSATQGSYVYAVRQALPSEATCTLCIKRYPGKLRVRCAASATQGSYVYAVHQALPREATCTLCGKRYPAKLRVRFAVFLLAMERIRLKDPVVEKGSTWIAGNFC